MSELLLRSIRRRALWEPGADLDTLLSTEFPPEQDGSHLNMSCYEVLDSQIVQALAEHAAGSRLNPHVFLGLDVTSARSVIATPGTTGFPFTIAAHRELHFKDDADLREFVERTLLPTITVRIRETSKDEVRAYVRSQLELNVTEWITHIGGFPKWEKFCRPTERRRG